MNQYDKCQELYEECVQRNMEALGFEHQDTLLSLTNLVLLYDTIGYYEQAKIWVLKYQEVLGQDHPYAIELQSSLDAYHQQIEQQRSEG